MSATGALGGLLVALLGWSLLGEVLHAGVAVSGVLPGHRDRLPPWQVLGPLVLLDEVWLVVAIAWVQTGFPATEHTAWTRAWAPLLAAVLLSVVQFLLLLLGPLLEGAKPYRGVLACVGLAVPTAWTAALALTAQAPVAPRVVGGLVAVASTAALGLGFAQLRSPRARRGRARGLAVGGALGAAAVLAWALGSAGPELLTPDAAPTTQRLLAVCAVVSLPVVLVLQGAAWRWVLRRPATGIGWASLAAPARNPAGDLALPSPRGDLR